MTINIPSTEAKQKETHALFPEMHTNISLKNSSEYVIK